MAVVRPATVEDLPAVAAYLAQQLKGEGGPARYRRFFEYSWPADRPNIGFLVQDRARVRGFLGALYARRLVRGIEHKLCNISSWAVDDEHRKLSLSMIKRLLDQKDHTFTCFSPSAKVVEILGFFKFQKLETEKVIVTPLSAARGLLGPARRLRVRHGAGIEAYLDPMQLRLYRDHAGYRLGHFLIEEGARSCYVVTGRRGRGPRIFADVLHVDDPEMLLDCLPQLAWPLFRYHGTLLVGLDRRYVPRLPALSYVYGGLRPVQFRSATLEAKEIDALYTELVPMFS